MELDGRDNAITLKRTQAWPWDSDLQVEVIMRRYPDCNAGGTIEDVARDAKIALYAPAADGVLLLRTGKRYYSINPATCNVVKLKDGPEERGPKAGTFQEQDGTFQYLPAPAKASEADDASAR